MNSTFDGNAVRKEEAVEDGEVTPMPVQKTETKKKPAKAAAKAETAEVPEMEESKKHSACSEPSYVYRALQWIQCNLKAPKNLYNKFGKYNYRNAEGILEAVKPYLEKCHCMLIMKDEVVQIGEHYYIKAIARFINPFTTDEITAEALAQECQHTGMSADQCTGCASSYARKYCLNALFLLDDTKDSDTDEVKRIEQANANTANAGASRSQTRSSGNSGGNGWGRSASNSNSSGNSGWDRK